MVTRSRCLSCCLTLAIAVTVCCLPVTADDEVSTKLGAYMDAARSVQNFNGSVCVTQGDRTLLSQGYGYANEEHHVANTPATRFRIGSMTKSFTAMAVMVLHEQGKLHIKDLITKHLTDAPEAWSEVTIHHLLTHTSGIPSYTDFPDYGTTMMLPQTTADMIHRFADKPLDFAPGTEFRYSNSGYFLLGVIVENVSGKSYEEFLQEAVLGPLHLDATGYDRYTTVLPDRASGYEVKGDKLVHAAYLDMSQPYAAGALYSTVEDLQKWGRALLDGKLLSKEGYTRMWTPEKDDYAYGWFVDSRDGIRRISHGGAIHGFQSALLLVPEAELSVVVLSNHWPSDPGGVAEALVGIAIGKDVELPEARKIVQVDKQVLEAYQGKYRFLPQLVVVVRLEGDKLVAGPEGQPPGELQPESETRFFVPSFGAQLRFVKNQDGKVAEAFLTLGGREVRGEKID